MVTIYIFMLLTLEELLPCKLLIKYVKLHTNINTNSTAN